MAKARAADKVYAVSTIIPDIGRVQFRAPETLLMMGLALAMFIALFAFGGQMLGWSDPGGKVQLGLFMSFLFGIVCGYRTRG